MSAPPDDDLFFAPVSPFWRAAFFVSVFAVVAIVLALLAGSGSFGIWAQRGFWAAFGLAI